MTTKQHEVLSLISEKTRHQNDDTQMPIISYWCPDKKNEWCQALQRDIFVDGAGFVSSLKAMERKGWIKSEAAAKYAYSITEDGRVALESHREATSFYAR